MSEVSEPSRRRPGTIGEAVTARANAFELRWHPSGHVYHYNDIIPLFQSQPEKPIKIGAQKGMEILTYLQTVLHPELFQPKGAYDGKKNLYSTKSYKFGVQEFKVPLNPTGKPARNPKMVAVRVTYAASINMSVLQNLVSGKLLQHNLSSDSTVSTTLNMLNIFVQAAPRLQFPTTHNARAFYATDARMDCAGFQLWRGYFQSVRPTFDRIIVNVDITVGVVLPAVPLESLCMEFLKLRDMRRLHNLEHPQFQELRRLLRNVKVSIELGKHKNKRPKKIADVVLRVGERTFEKDEVPVTIADHFKQIHDVDVPRGSLGILTTTRELFPMKCCRTILQLYRGRPPPEVVRNAMQFMPPTPVERMKAIQRSWNQLSYDQSYFLQDAGIKISPTPVQVAARILPSPPIRFRDDERASKRAGVWDVIHKIFFEPATIRSWAVVNLGATQTQTVNSFINDLVKAMHERGIRIPRDPVAFIAASPSVAIETLEECLRSTGAALIIVILPENAAPLYTAVKRFGDITKGVATQCVRWSSKIYQGYSQNRCNQYHNNLILKINGKCGGINSKPSCPTLDWLRKKGPTMILGADVSHASPGSTLPSVAALVSSYDINMCKYAASIRIQRCRAEIIEDLKDMIIRALDIFRQANQGVLPAYLIFYRDGVSEGEFHSVHRFEIRQYIASALAHVYGSDFQKWPSIVFIVVGKRHHTRFIPESPAAIDRAGNGNCLSGFVVDQSIVHPVYHDFYLQSQAGLKGTSRPSHYTVLRDDFIKSTDIIQQLSYALCHCYARATRAVSIPAPVYYADLVCRRAKFHFDDDINFSDNMSAASEDSDTSQLKFYKDHFRTMNSRIRNTMYFL